MHEYQLPTEQAMHQLAQALAKHLTGGLVIHLLGDLGAGKTTFARGLIRALGYAGKVKSPTFTLVEPYDFSDKTVFHFDLYRIVAADELLHIGLDDYFNERAICLIEWPERGNPILPRADISCKIEVEGDSRTLTLEAGTQKGKNILQQLEV